MPSAGKGRERPSAGKRRGRRSASTGRGRPSADKGRGRPRNPAEAADALRAAVDQTFQATLGARGRAQELVDEIATLAGRVRGALDDLRLATGDDIKALHQEIEALERRVAALEKASRRRG
jgi:hypothetical protein